MKNKMIYGSDKDDFIWKMETVYNPIEKLHYILAKWHLSKLLKINQEAIDKLYNKAYNDIIKEMKYDFKALDLTDWSAERLIDKINEISESYWTSCEDIEKGLENTAKYFEREYPLYDTETMHTVVKVERR